MKALSIHQPWAWAILHAGKSVENRSWRTDHRGPLLIHASKSRASYDRQRAEDWRRVLNIELPPWESLPTGRLVGVVSVLDCIPLENGGFGSHSPWASGPWLWVLSDPRPFPEPVVFRGLQNLFNVPADLIPEAYR